MDEENCRVVHSPDEASGKIIALSQGWLCWGLTWWSLTVTVRNGRIMVGFRAKPVPSDTRHWETGPGAQDLRQWKPSRRSAWKRRPWREIRSQILGHWFVCGRSDSSKFWTASRQCGSALLVAKQQLMPLYLPSYARNVLLCCGKAKSRWSRDRENAAIRPCCIAVPLPWEVQMTNPWVDEG